MRGVGIIPVDLLNRAIASQAAGARIPDILTPEEMAFMGTVWNDARNYADFNGVPWAALGYPSGPPLSPQARAGLAYVWSQIRVAANWTDPRWDFHRIPANIVASAMPLPEVATATPVPATPTVAPPVTGTPAPTSPTFQVSTPYNPTPSYFSTQPIEGDAVETPAAGPVKAGLFSGSLPSWVLPLVAVALAMPIILPNKGGSRRRR